MITVLILLHSKVLNFTVVFFFFFFFFVVVVVVVLFLFVFVVFFFLLFLMCFSVLKANDFISYLLVLPQSVIFRIYM